MAVIEGRDPATGAALVVEMSSNTITSVHRRTTTDRSLPWVLPGLIDVQVNGYAGHDVNGDGVSAESVAEITDKLARHGVTTWVPTVVTASEEAIVASLRAVSAARADDPQVAAAIPFCHIEGPFLSELDGPRGAHDIDQIRPLAANEVARWAEHGPVGYITLSPHTSEAPEHIAQIVASGCQVAIGHTHASPAQITAAVDAGASLSTHLGNGIFASLPRHPNPIWTQLADPRLTCGFIGDGHHLPADALTAMIRAKGPGKAFLVSDSVALAGSPPGLYDAPVGGAVEMRNNGSLVLAGTNLLAGSAVNLSDVLSFVLNHTALALEEIVDLVCTVPSRIIRDPSRGRVQAGHRADLVLIDNHGAVMDVVRGGQLL